MEILVANNHLAHTGGSENYSYAIIAELLRLGHDVEYFTFHKGYVSDKIEQLGARFMSKQRYDAIIANHRPVIQRLFQHGFIIQTSHGILPGLEEPSLFADCHVCVSAFQQKYFLERKINCRVIPNGIDCERFYPETPVHKKLTRVLSLCQSEEANKLVAFCCKRMNIEFMECSKSKDDMWDIEKEINKADLVIGVGLSLYDAMACGRAVISYDTRYIDKNFEGDGYLDKNNINASLAFNCCGGFNRIFFTPDKFIAELKKYDWRDGAFMREFAVKELNIRKSVESYLAVYHENIRAYTRDTRLADYYNELNIEIENLKAEINALHSSKSWRITLPLRSIFGMMRKLKRKKAVRTEKHQ
jgi:glycosyltransferase involved in cell wall biosynthesis